MSGEGGTRVRTTIVKVPDANPGLLFIDGQQRSFRLEGVWRSPVAPAVNMPVDVDFDSAGSIVAITAVDQQQLNKERLNQLSGVAQERGKEAAKLAQQGIGALAAKMGAVALGSAVLIWIAWFFFPAAGISGGMTGSLSYTFWDLLGVDFNDPMSVMGGKGSHGLLAIIGIVAIAAPFAAPFLKMPWAKYLNAAPLAVVVIGWLAVFMNEHKAFGDVAKLVGSSPFSFSWGIFVLVLATLVLASQVLKPQTAV